MTTKLISNNLGKVLAVSGGLAFTLIGIALLRKKLKGLSADSQSIHASNIKKWEIERVSLEKDKEILEMKLRELENILERMGKEIESLKASLKEKQQIISARDVEKERMKENERKLRKEWNDQVEQLTRRGQQFLREIEEKTIVCDSQCQTMSTMESLNKQLMLEKEQLSQQLEEKEVRIRDVQSQLSTMTHTLEKKDEHLSRVSSQRDQLAQDLRFVLANFVFKNHRAASQADQSGLVDQAWPPSSISPTFLINNVDHHLQDSPIAALIQRLTQQGILTNDLLLAARDEGYNGGMNGANGNNYTSPRANGKPQSNGHENNESSDASFSMSVNGVNGTSKKRFQSLIGTPAIIPAGVQI
jgi:DNA polymerase III alpha subunit (gram-positive type)